MHAVIASLLLLASPPVSLADEQAIHAIASRFAEAWNRHDMTALARLYAPDADFVNVIGLHWRGREEIERQHAALHATRMKASRLTITGTTERSLRPDVALAHVTWKLEGDTGAREPRTEPREGVLTLVLTREDGAWLIAASQNTDIVHAPNVPPP